MKKLFLIDAYALIFRGYYAFIKNPRINSKGEDTSAVMGFVNSLFDLLRREQPDYLAVAFDRGGSTDREIIYKEYKANRAETPEPILLAVPYIKEILAAMHIPIIEEAGYEADDLIGTLALQASKKDYEVFMVTPDKDFAQLVTDKIKMYRPSKTGSGIEILGVEEVKTKFEVEHPKQIIDYLAMMGDSVDNIPGLPGVGAKTAIKFIKEYGSLENLLDRAHEIKGKLGEKIRANKALGILSKQLATIILDCPVTFDPEAFLQTLPDHQKVITLFRTLEFRRLEQQFLSIYPTDETPQTQEEPSKTLEHHQGSVQTGLFDPIVSPEQEDSFQGLYQKVQGPTGEKLLIDLLQQEHQIAFETHWGKEDDTLQGISFCWHPHQVYYLPYHQSLRTEIETLFQNPNKLLMGQDLKPQLKNLKRVLNFELNTSLFDATLAHYVLSPDTNHELQVLTQSFLNKMLKDYEEDWNNTCHRADMVFQLRAKLEEALKQINGSNIFKAIESPLLPVLLDMEETGISLDIDQLNELSTKVKTQAAAIAQRIYEQVGKTFNIASPKQLGEILFEELKITDKPKKTKTKQYSTSEETLLKLKEAHPIVSEVLTWRQLVKLDNTYLEALPKQINPQTGKIHTTLLQTGTVTGRLSSRNPNLQNIPIRTELGRQVRQAFVPSKGRVLMAADYSQVELRIIAALSGDEKMIAAFEQDLDIHATTAANVFNVPLDQVTKEQRSQAKTVNFGIIYGVSAFGLSNQTVLSRSESKELIDRYFETYPKLKSYTEQQIAFAIEQGYVQTVTGRRRMLPAIHSQNVLLKGEAERMAVNMPIQGSAADIIKIAMINIHKMLKDEGFESKMLLQIHDELIFDVVPEEQQVLTEKIKTEMSQAYTLKVPLRVEVGVGSNWLEAH